VPELPWTGLLRIFPIKKILFFWCFLWHDNNAMFLTLFVHERSAPAEEYTDEGRYNHHEDPADIRDDREG
jgi:hypothetical protein